MNYYAAPMEGLTDRIWRQVHQKWFGAADAPTRYYAPFLSPPENRVLIPKKMAELAPEANAGTVVIPQLLARDGELAAWMIGEVRKLGYTEANLNFGCPSGTVTAKGKGAGMLRDPARLDAFLDAVFSAVEGPVSVKTRIGVQNPEEFAALLDIYNHYPICELTIHPRVMKPVSYTHLRAHETDSYLVCRLLLEKKKKERKKPLTKICLIFHLYHSLGNKSI